MAALTSSTPLRARLYEGSSGLSKNHIEIETGPVPEEADARSPRNGGCNPLSLKWTQPSTRSFRVKIKKSGNFTRAGMRRFLLFGHANLSGKVNGISRKERTHSRASFPEAHANPSSLETLSSYSRRDIPSCCSHVRCMPPPPGLGVGGSVAAKSTGSLSTRNAFLSGSHAQGSPGWVSSQREGQPPKRQANKRKLGLRLPASARASP